MFQLLRRLRWPSLRPFVALFLAPRTTTAALVAFNDTIDELATVAEHHTASAIAKTAMISHLQQQVDAHNTEFSSALAIKSKLQALLA